jgi:hypothetical protein
LKFTQSRQDKNLKCSSFRNFFPKKWIIQKHPAISGLLSTCVFVNGPEPLRVMKIWVRIKLFEFDKLWEIFKKSSEHYKKCLIFCSNLFYSFCFKSTKKICQNGHFDFSRRWPNNFYMLCEKSYDMVLIKINWKYFKTYHFLFKNFQTNFSGIISWKYWECHFLLCSNMSLFCFYALVYTLDHTFSNKTTVQQKSIVALFYSKLKKKIITLKLTELVRRPIHRVKFDKFNSWKIIFLSMCSNFAFFRLFSKI